MDRTGRISIEQEDRDTAVGSLGNLPVTKKGSRPPDTPFLPSRRLRAYAAMLEHLTEAGVVYRGSRKLEADVLRDLRVVGAVAISETDGEVTKLMDATEFVAECRTRMGKPPYTRFWELVRAMIPYQQAINDAFGLADLSPVSRQALGVMLVNWGKQLGLLERKRYHKGTRLDFRPRRTRETSLFDELVS
jgi:hypothetical protein